MVSELKVRSMILLAVAFLVFCTGASLARLVTRDALSEGLRERWKVHFVWRQEQILASVQRRYPIQDVAVAKFLAESARGGRPIRRADEVTPEELRYALLHEIGERSEAELPVPLWMVGQRRAAVRPWSRISARLVRVQGYMDFIVCPWCLPVYAYAAVALYTWWRLYGFELSLTYAELSSVAFPADWLAVTGLLTARWIYALIATRLD